MRLIRLASLRLLAFALALSPFAAKAVTLHLDTTTALSLSLEVTASTGAPPIQRILEPVDDAPVAGGMELTPAGSLGEYDMTYSFSLYSDTSEFVATGSYGPGAIPVTLRIDEIFYETAAPERVGFAPSWELTGLIAGALTGSLTVGTTSAPLSLTSLAQGYTDAQPCPSGCMSAGFEPWVGRLGWEDPLGGTGLFSGLGAFSADDVITADGTTFDVTVRFEFQRIVYVPEPSIAWLLAVVGAAVAARRVQLSSKPS